MPVLNDDGDITISNVNPHGTRYNMPNHLLKKLRDFFEVRLVSRCVPLQTTAPRVFFGGLTGCWSALIASQQGILPTNWN